MLPPVAVDLRLYRLQMGAADGEGHAVFQHRHAVFDLHDMDEVDDAAPVDVEKLLRSQLLVDLLQAFPNLGHPAGRGDAGIFSVPFNEIDLPVREFFQAAAGLDGIGFPVLQGDRAMASRRAAGRRWASSAFGTYRKMDRAKASMAYSTWEVMKMIFPWGRWGGICSAISRPVHPGISMSAG